LTRDRSPRTRVGAVGVLDDEQHVEHPDDPALDEVEQQRDRFSRHGRIGRVADHHDVDRAQLFDLVLHARDGAPTGPLANHPIGVKPGS